MDSQDEMIMKKKRSKRPRMAVSPLSLTMATTSSCSNGGGGGGGHDHSNSSSSSVGFILAKEEEDMANCLILLAKGRHSHESLPAATDKAAVVVAEGVAEPITDPYQCKTCNRTFHSFQALGGHRASHKKPKTIPLEDQAKIKRAPPPLTMEQECSETTTLSLQITTTRALTNPNKVRVHECSICGAEFSSGQALGGHMRRHRPIPMVTSNQNQEFHQDQAKKSKSKSKTLLSLDLNQLPAPEDDNYSESKFPFAGKEQVIVFSASPLVDCHY